MTRSSSSRRRSRRCVTKWNAFASRMTTACRSWNGRVAMNATSCSGRSWRSERIWSETMPDPQPTPALLLDPDAAKRLRQAELLLDIPRNDAAIASLDEALDTPNATTTADAGANRGLPCPKDPPQG